MLSNSFDSNYSNSNNISKFLIFTNIIFADQWDVKLEFYDYFLTNHGVNQC
jgi:hypothetical protein